MYAKNGRGQRKSINAIASTLGVQWRTVRQWLQEEGLSTRRTLYDHHAIASDIRVGKPYVEIYRKHGCSWWTIDQVKKKMKKGDL